MRSLVHTGLLTVAVSAVMASTAIQAFAQQTRIYPLWAQEKDIPAMEFPNASGKRVDMMYPADNEYWAKLKEFEPPPG